MGCRKSREVLSRRLAPPRKKMVDFFFALQPLLSGDVYNQCVASAAKARHRRVHD